MRLKSFEDSVTWHFKIFSRNRSFDFLKSVLTNENKSGKINIIVEIQSIQGNNTI